MSLELVNTIAAFSTTAVIAATAVFALVQLRHMRASNQITGFLTLRQMLDDDAHQRAAATMEREGDVTHDPDFRTYALSVWAGKPAGDNERMRSIRLAVIMIGNSFDIMGTLVRNNVVDRRLFLEQYCATTVNTWRRMEPYIIFFRDLQSDDGLWEDFEYMVVLSKDYLAATPTVFPKGVARILPSYEKRPDKV